MRHAAERRPPAGPVAVKMQSGGSAERPVGAAGLERRPLVGTRCATAQRTARRRPAGWFSLGATGRRGRSRTSVAQDDERRVARGPSVSMGTENVPLLGIENVPLFRGGEESAGSCVEGIGRVCAGGRPRLTRTKGVEGAERPERPEIRVRRGRGFIGWPRGPRRDPGRGSFARRPG